MSRIDEPLDQIESQHRDDKGQALSIALNVAAPLMDLLSPGVGALTALLAFVTSFREDHHQESRAQAFQDGLREAVAGLDARIEIIEKKAAGPDAAEAIVTAIRSALGSARLDKARMYGRILGATVAQDTPNWQEAAEFIRNLEQFTDSDFQALRILWKVQRSALHTDSSDEHNMPTGADIYTQTWSGVLDHVEKARISKDDWHARCARLSGFGLTGPVQPNPSRQRTDDVCYRMTGRAVRLLKLLGQNVNPGAYPSVRYHASKPSRTVNDEEEDRALGEGWADTPAAFKRP